MGARCKVATFPGGGGAGGRGATFYPKIYNIPKSMTLGS